MNFQICKREWRKERKTKGKFRNPEKENKNEEKIGKAHKCH